MSVISLPKNYSNKFSANNSKNKNSSLIDNVDLPLLLSSLFLLGLGLVMVASSSISISERELSDPLYYFWRQFTYSIVGLTSAFLMFKIPLSYIQKIGPTLIILSLVLLLMVLIPGIGREVNGSIRWLNLGFISLQVSEFAKLATVIYLAGYLVRHNEEVRTNLSGFLRPLGVIFIISVLLILEPDFGAVAVIAMTAMGMLWLGGASFFQFIFLMLTMAAVLTLTAISSPYRMERLTTFLNPWADPFDSGFQLTQALIAFGRGEWFGVGLGSSVQKLFYLPEAHTDFVFAVLAEELGLFSVVLVVAIYCFIVIRALMIGRRAEKRERPFTAFMAYGLGIWLGLQAFINIGVNMGVLPTKGLTLPLMSYGGSSLIIMCVVIGILLRADYETHLHDRTAQHKRKKSSVGAAW
ncbi:MAG: putative lipid II flippase FtsW [Woeseiaceae bacterium]